MASGATTRWLVARQTSLVQYGSCCPVLTIAPPPREARTGSPRRAIRLRRALVGRRALRLHLQTHRAARWLEQQKREGGKVGVLPILMAPGSCGRDGPFGGGGSG